MTLTFTGQISPSPLPFPSPHIYSLALSHHRHGHHRRHHCATSFPGTAHNQIRRITGRRWNLHNGSPQNPIYNPKHIPIKYPQKDCDSTSNQRLKIQKMLRPLSNFVFGRRSIWEGGVGMFLVSGTVLLALSLVWLRAFQLKSRFRKYLAVFGDGRWLLLVVDGVGDGNGKSIHNRYSIFCEGNPSKFGVGF